MCIYVATPLSESAAMLVILKPAGPAILENSTGLTHIKTGTATFFDEAYGHMNGPTYMSPNANSIQNMVYASNGNHPSNIIAAMNGPIPVFMDQVTVIGSSTSSYAKVPETNIHSKEYVKRGFAGDGGGHVFGWGTCQWLRKCDFPGAIEGSSCSATLSNVLYQGYCFTSDTGTLECGRLAATDDEYGENPIAFDGAISPNLLPSVAGAVDVEGLAPATTTYASTPGATTSVYRCPTGSPAKTLGSFVSKRMLSAGCMITSDPSFDPLAEVHVPAYCTTPVDYTGKVGCMLPSGINYDPAAKQVGVCKFPTMGCMDPGAVNYNSLATMTDPDKPCITRVIGCTVASATYEGIDSNTPQYKSGFYGSAANGAGGQAFLKVPEATYGGPAVLNYNPQANVNSGCVVAVEGCMDPTARNYDPLATVNSYTWCVPSVPGCMVPDEYAVGPSYSNTEKVSTELGGTVDSPTSSFSATTTLHTPSMCINGRRGCMLERARNYDPLATINTTCYGRVKGCLNPGAVNFGCPPPKDMFDDNCLTSHTGMSKPTRHTVRFCRWTNESPPPSPPPPPHPPTDEYVLTYTTGLEMECEGTVEGLEALNEEFAATFRELMALPADYPVKVTVTDLDARRRLKDGRRNLAESTGQVDMEASFDNAEEAESASDTMVSNVGTSSSSAQAAFASTGVTVLSAPTHTSEVTAVEIEDDGSDSAALIGGIVGGIGGFLMLIGIGAWVYKRKHAKQTYPA